MAGDVQSRLLGPNASRFLDLKAQGLKGRTRLLGRLTPATVGLRPQDKAHAPSAAHFRSANKRLAEIDRSIRLRLGQLHQLGRDAARDDRLLALAMVERELDRARRAFGLFFEVF